jgi:hypothetical protein
LDFSPGDAYVFASSFDCTVELWCCGSGESLKSLQGHADPISALPSRFTAPWFGQVPRALEDRAGPHLVYPLCSLLAGGAPALLSSLNSGRREALQLRLRRVLGDSAGLPGFHGLLAFSLAGAFFWARSVGSTAKL